jgi:CRISPR-associated endoribonuclease Cas6
MPYSLVLHCVSPSGTVCPEDLQGQKGLALFLEELIEKQDAALAAQLHAPRNAKPFTTAILHRTRTDREPRARAATDRPGARQAMLPAGEMQIRITLLDDALYPRVSQFFLQHLNGVPLLRLGHSMLAVSRVMTTPESGEPWAGFARFEELLARASEHETAWRIQFVTPTAFKTGDAAMPLPVPRLCFQSWLNSWDEHAPLPFFQDKTMRRAFLADVVEWGVSVIYDHLRLVQAPLYFDGARTREQRFVGTCRFTAKSSKIAPAHRKILATLAAYSYYAGTGRKTTMGMGLTRRL